LKIRKFHDDYTLVLTTNAEDKIFSEVAMLKKLPIEVFLNKDSIATILAFCNVANFEGVSITTGASDYRHSRG